MILCTLQLSIFVIQEGKVDGEMTPLEHILEKVMKDRYTYEELMEEELPDGVDPKRLESYLDDEEFEVSSFDDSSFYTLHLPSVM